jgi:hypothetical protein
MSSKGNGIEIRYFDGSRTIRMLAWHNSTVVNKNSFVENEVIGHIGNSGLVLPEPTPHQPYAGSHLHLMTYVNNQLVNPREIFDFNQWYKGTDNLLEEIKLDLLPIAWFLEKIKDAINKLK